jgi:NAD(P)-dependent dehydrogenase (short-subunit alcohol dehydrogenase family)
MPLKALVPMKRYGTNEAVARMAVFLASDESSFCTGAIHLIDGGFTAG